MNRRRERVVFENNQTRPVAWGVIGNQDEIMRRRGGEGLGRSGPRLSALPPPRLPRGAGPRSRGAGRKKLVKANLGSPRARQGVIGRNPEITLRFSAVTWTDSGGRGADPMPGKHQGYTTGGWLFPSLSLKFRGKRKGQMAPFQLRRMPGDYSAGWCAGAADRRRPSAATTLRTVENSGFPFPLNAR